MRHWIKVVICKFMTEGCICHCLLLETPANLAVPKSICQMNTSSIYRKRELLTLCKKQLRFQNVEEFLPWSCMNIHWLLRMMAFGGTVTEYIRKIAYQSVIKCNARTPKLNMHDKLALEEAEQACPLNPATESHWNSFYYEWAEGQTEPQMIGGNLWLQRLLNPCITKKSQPKMLHNCEIMAIIH